MATLQTITSLCQSKLGDQDIAVFTLTYLLPFINSAQRQLVGELVSAGVERVHVRAQTPLTIPAATLVISATSSPPFPSDFIEPDQLYERPQGGLVSDYVRMEGPRELPDIAQGSILGYWDWQGGKINLVGATTIREVRMDYWASLVSFASPTDTVLILESTEALAAITCRDVALAVENLSAAQAFSLQAQVEIDKIVNREVKIEQDVADRRLPSRLLNRYNYRGV